jgi:hypothetical protein
MRRSAACVRFAAANGAPPGHSVVPAMSCGPICRHDQLSFLGEKPYISLDSLIFDAADLKKSTFS